MKVRDTTVTTCKTRQDYVYSETLKWSLCRNEASKWNSGSLQKYTVRTFIRNDDIHIHDDIYVKSPNTMYKLVKVPLHSSI